MGIRIQPLDIEIPDDPEDDPFKSDLLGRKESIEVLTHLVRSIDGPCVIAVDSEWGSGKTTFLRIWAQFLSNDNFPVIQFNAWETDFADDPLVALSSELASGLEQFPEVSERSIGRLSSVAKKLIRIVAPLAVNAVTGGLVDLEAIIRQLREDSESYAEIRLTKYREGKEYFKHFTDSLESTASALSQSRCGRPLMVMIDELDRCRPTYAIELLEVAKHLFSANHVVFVLAVNRDELAHSVKSVYGNEFDAQEYLRRFFDVDLVLPEPDRESFIRALLDEIRFIEYFSRTKDSEAVVTRDLCSAMLEDAFSGSHVSVRGVSQAIHRLGLVLGTLRSNQRSFAIGAVIGLILRTIDAERYRRFVRGDISDREVVDSIFEGVRGDELRKRRSISQFEASIVVAGREIAASLGRPSYSSPLIDYYRQMVAEQQIPVSSQRDLDEAGKTCTVGYRVG